MIFLYTYKYKKQPGKLKLLFFKMLTIKNIYVFLFLKTDLRPIQIPIYHLGIFLRLEK